MLHKLNSINVIFRVHFKKQYLMKTILGHWNLMRFIRLAVAVLLLIQAIDAQNIYLGIGGGLFLIYVLLVPSACNTGTCGFNPKK